MASQPRHAWTASLSRRSTRKRLVQAVLDNIAWAIALVLAVIVRYGLDTSRVNFAKVALMLPIIWVAQIWGGRASGLYRGKWIFGSFEEVAAVARTVATATAVLIFADALRGENRPVPFVAAIAAGVIAFLLQGALRYAWRLVQERRFRMRATARTRVLVFGAGSGGIQAAHAMLHDEDSPYLPVAFLDDDAEKRGLSIMGVRVVGGREAMRAAAEKLEAQAMLVAVPSADAQLVRELIDLAVPLGLEVRVLPSVHELLGAQVEVADIRQPNERDFLGRHQVETDLQEIAGYLEGQVVLVTGAGGSIGSELCRQIAAFRPAEMIMVDRDESALHGVQLSLEGRALLDSPNLVLLDIRDRQRVRRLFMERRPDVVFHAAALKHLPLLESHPAEALKTNIWGTLAVLDAAAESGVRTFVNISTDKAANPKSVLGYSKRVAEGLTAWTATRIEGSYLSVRFGNVLGSRGSVLTTFRAQIGAGGPLTVTHPEVTRFFMTVEEAVQLVVQAGAVGSGGDVLVLDMGQPVRIADVARRLAAISETPVPIEYTGLRPGEKLHEELFGDGEVRRPSGHEQINAVTAPPLDPRHVRNIDPCQTTCELISAFEALCDKMAAADLERFMEGDGLSVSA
ncbi:MAG TPA: nucleoside-diphosphate sugar epimerase/dehydratase [Acidimicrobiia bacterium]